MLIEPTNVMKIVEKCDESLETDEQSDCGKADAFHPVVNAEIRPETIEISEIPLTSDRTIDSDKQSEGQNKGANDSVVDAEIKSETDETLDDIDNPDKISDCNEVGPIDSLKINPELHGKSEVNATSDEPINIVEESDSNEEERSGAGSEVEIEPKTDENLEEFNVDGNATKPDGTLQPTSPSHSPCRNEIDSNDMNSDDDVVEVPSEIVTVRKSTRSREKRKVASLSPDDATKAKVRSPRSDAF